MNAKLAVWFCGAVAAVSLFAEGGSGVMLEWMGKQKVVNHHNDVPFHVLERKYSFDAKGKHEEDNGSENMIIHGDNLVALKSLLPRYEGRVKCIYIDPPYNTGEEGWVYNDNVNDPQMLKWLGEVVGKEGEDFSRHDKWLCMMYPRLKLLHKLLADDGVIFISIDDNELFNLKLVCDEIFGLRNFISNFIWEKRVNRENRKVVSSRHDYILCYAKNIQKDRRPIKQLPMTGEALDRYQNPDNDPRGPWKSDPVTAQAGHATKNQFYTLKVPCGKEYTPPAGRCWLYTEPVMQQAIKDGRIWLGLDGKNTPRKKTYLTEKERGLTPESLWFAADVSTNEKAKNELKVIFPEIIPFTTPKPHELVEQMLKVATDKDSIVLDSFAGSATTAHAVLRANQEDGGSRKFILVELCDYAETVTAERARRVIKGYGSDDKKVEGTGGDFSFYELGPQLMIDGVLNEDVPTEKIREYVWYTETKQPIGAAEKGDAYKLGVAFGVAYYFCYEKEKSMTLNRALLKKIKTKAESYVVYADACTLSSEELEKMHITFTKIPRDVTRF